MRVLCVARHPFLSEHLGRYFERLGVDTMPCVGLRDAQRLAPKYDVDAVICDYDLLATASLDAWVSDPLVGAPSGHRRQSHAAPGRSPPRPKLTASRDFSYLPTLECRRCAAQCSPRYGTGVAGSHPPNVLPWPAPTPHRSSLS